MYHLDNTSGVPEMPEPKDAQSISPRWFGESQEQGGISWPGADWFNIIQAELINLVVEAGLSPDKSSFDQIASAVRGIGGDGLRRELDSAGGGAMLRLKHGETAQDAIKFVTPLTKSGVENAEYNYQLVQSLLNKGLHVDLKMGDIYFSQPVQTRKGQIIKGQGAPNFSPYCYTRVICLSEGGLFLVYRRLIYRTGQDAADYQSGAGRRLPCPL